MGVEKADVLKAEIKAARQRKSQHTTECQALRAKLDASKEEHETKRREMSAFQCSAALEKATPASAAATIAAKARSRSLSNNAAGRSGLYPDGTLPKGHD